MRATFLSLGLAAALALATSGSAFAQRHGGGGTAHGGAVHAGAVRGGAVHVSGYRGYYYGGRPYGHYGPYYGGGIYLGIGGPYAYGWPGYYDGFDYPYYPGPAYGFVSPGDYPLPPTIGAVPTAGPQPVMMTVLVPKPDAQVFLGDTATTTTGTERAFQSPPIEPGKSFQYTVRVRWTENGKTVEQKRDVPVQAGQQVTVDFRAPAREPIGLPVPK